MATDDVWGPLHGIPMTVKESFNVSGAPFGNPLWKDNIAASNPVVVDRLLEAGAIVFGKTNVPYMLKFCIADTSGSAGSDHVCDAGAV